MHVHWLSEIQPMTEKRKPGRPRGEGINDDRALAMIAELMVTKPCGLFAAAKEVSQCSPWSEKAGGSEASLRRFQRKWKVNDIGKKLVAEARANARQALPARHSVVGAAVTIAHDAATGWSPSRCDVTTANIWGDPPVRSPAHQSVVDAVDMFARPVMPPGQSVAIDWFQIEQGRQAAYRALRDIEAAGGMHVVLKQAKIAQDAAANFYAFRKKHEG
jgi:hypothetical protein